MSHEIGALSFSAITLSSLLIIKDKEDDLIVLTVVLSKEFRNLIVSI